jgi:hypothetical protein
MSLLIELAGPCFADGERVEWPKSEAPDTFFAAHPGDLEMWRGDDPRAPIRIAKFLPTGRRTPDGALVYEFNKRWS